MGSFEVLSVTDSAPLRVAWRWPALMTIMLKTGHQANSLSFVFDTLSQACARKHHDHYSAGISSAFCMFGSHTTLYTTSMATPVA